METTTLYEESKGITGVAYWDNGFKLMSANKPIRDGGMAVAAILAAGLLSAVSGSSPATVVAIGSIMLPAMLRHGYPKRYAAGVITIGGSLGNMIPPSIVMVIYSIATSGMLIKGPNGNIVGNASVGQLFMAGLVPGIVLAFLLSGIAWYLAWRNGYPRMTRAGWMARWNALRESVWGVMLIVIVLGGIYAGWFTPTEAAAMSAVYAFLVAVFVYKDMPLSRIPRVLLDSANMSAMLLYIITNAVLFSFLMAHENIPQAMSSWITTTGLTSFEFLLFVNLLLLVAGNVTEPSSIVLIMAPILFPIAVTLGVDPVHFGVLITLNMEIGMCHPPVGLNLYVASGIAKMGITELTIAVLPYLAGLLFFLVVVTYWPGLSLWLPRLLGMM